MGKKVNKNVCRALIVRKNWRKILSRFSFSREFFFSLFFGTNRSLSSVVQFVSRGKKEKYNFQFKFRYFSQFLNIFSLFVSIRFFKKSKRLTYFLNYFCFYCSKKNNYFDHYIEFSIYSFLFLKLWLKERNIFDKLSPFVWRWNFIRKKWFNDEITKSI